MKKRQIGLQFPLGGLARSRGFQNQPPFTCPDALNVRGVDPILNRDRGGSRPGLTRYCDTQLESGSPIRLLNAVTCMTNDGLSSVSDDFSGSTMSAAWTGASWIGTGALPSILPGNLADVTFNTPAGAVYQSVSDFSASFPYQIDLFVVPYNGQHNGKYQIFARMNNATPVATTDGIVAELVMADGVGTYSGTLKVYAASVLTNTYTFTGGATGAAEVGVFSVLINGNNVSCTWNGNVLLAATAVSAAAGARVGFGMNATVAGGLCLVNYFRLQYQTGTNKQVLRRILCAASAGNMYRETFLRTMAKSASVLSVAFDGRQVQSAERLQKLYIADCSDPRNNPTTSTDGVIGSTNRLSAASIADWTTLGIRISDDVVVLSNGLGGTVSQTYAITAIAAGFITLGNQPNGSAPGNGTCTYRIERGVKVYDPIAETLTLLMAGASGGNNLGQVPAGCPCIATYRDRIVVAGQPIAPHAWFMSRQGTPTDWDYSAASSDGGRAVAGAVTTAGLVGDPITALIAHGDDYMIFGCPSSLWIMRGDPAYGGTIDNLSRTVGIVDKDAWCRGPNGEVTFLSRDGLYSIAPGASQFPQRLSRDNLPQEMLDLDNTLYSISMGYDVRDRGIHIYMNPKNASGRRHYFYDVRYQAFWPMQLPNAMGPNCVLAHNCFQSPKDSALLLGCADGYIRRYHDQQETDNGTAISNYVMIGPVRLGGSDYTTGIITELVAMIGANSGSVAWSVIAGNESEDISATTTAARTGTFSRATLNLKARPRVRAGSMLLKLSNVSSRKWALESLVAVVEQGIQQRLGS